MNESNDDQAIDRKSIENRVKRMLWGISPNECAARRKKETKDE